MTNSDDIAVERQFVEKMGYNSGGNACENRTYSYPFDRGGGPGDLPQYRDFNPALRFFDIDENGRFDHFKEVG